MHIEQHEQLLNQLSTALKHHPEFEHAFSDFEAQKVCYLPIGAFLLKPIQHLLHYHSLLERELVDVQTCIQLQLLRMIKAWTSLR